MLAMRNSAVEIMKPNTDISAMYRIKMAKMARSDFVSAFLDNASSS